MMNLISSKQMESSELKLYKTDEVAELLRVSPRTVQSWIRDGSLPHIRLGNGGRLVRIQAKDLDAFIKQGYQGGGS